MQAPAAASPISGPLTAPSVASGRDEEKKKKTLYNENLGKPVKREGGGDARVGFRRVECVTLRGGRPGCLPFLADSNLIQPGTRPNS